MTFALLALICLVALSGPLFNLSPALRLPVVIGELFVGVALGETGLRIVDGSDPTLTFLAEIGFALVMFVAGTHVPLRRPAMRAGLPRGILRAVLVGVLAIPAGFGLAALFGTGHGSLYAVVLASSSASLVMPVLGGRVTSPAGVQMLVQLAVADATCIVALPLVLQTDRAGTAALGSLAVVAAGGVVYLVLRWAEAGGWRRRVHDLSEERGLAVELRVTLTLLFGLAAIAVVSHVSIMLAGFTLGLAVAAVGEPKRVKNQAFALTEGFFGPVFFVWLGATLNLRDLLSHPQAVALGLCLGLGAVLVHGAMALTRQPWPVAVVTAAQLGVPVGAVTIGTPLGVFAPGERAALLLGALVTVGAVALVARPLRDAIRTDPAAHRG
ncbi:cation:proton antiporter [Propionicicella superfundia]|uniref:cation:proton antiporter n=1 Tax=Propionicicella superfundia TaxID=348582 RepID=UPI00041ED0B8|nr:cation:proton antiporter [Propionicicella superfundia]